MVHLQTLGGLCLSHDDGRRIAFPEKGLLIVCYLAKNEPTASRTVIAGLLWGNAEPTRSHSNLRKTISRMREDEKAADVSIFDFINDAIMLKHGSVTIDSDGLVCGDAVFPALAHLTKALKLPFLQGVDLPSGRFQSWVLAERERHAGLLREAVLKALELPLSVGHLNDVRAAALHYLEHDPHDTSIQQVLRSAVGSDVPGTAINVVPLPRRPTTEAHAETYDALSRQLSRVQRVLLQQNKPERATAFFHSGLPRLALLPPAPTNGHQALPALAGALVEDITIGLCGLRTVAVVAPYTSEQIRRDSDKAGTIRRHAISYILDTRISDNGLFSQLIYFPTDEIIWADRFPLSSDTLFRQREDLARHIIERVAGELDRNEQCRLDFEANPAAYHAYLLGMRYLGQLTLPEIRRARKMFRDSLRHSAYFSPSLSGLARTFTVEWLLTARGDEQLLRLAEQYAAKAIAIDGKLASGHRELGVARLYLGDVDESVHALHLAESLSPHYADVLYSYADTLVHASRVQEGLEKIEKAISLNPLCPDAYLWSAAGASYFLNRYEDALGYVHRMKDQTPADRLAAASWAMLGEKRKAGLHRQRVYKSNPDFGLDRWLAVVPIKEAWQKDLYREGLSKAGF